MAAVPAGLITVPLLKALINSKTHSVRPIAMAIFLFSIVVAIWLGIGSCMPINKALT